MRLVQSNMIGKMAMVSCDSYAKVEDFTFLPFNYFSISPTTFISQNLRVQWYDRVRKGTRFGVLRGILPAKIIGIIVYIPAPYILPHLTVILLWYSST